MIKIGDVEYYSTAEVCKITGKKSGVVQKFARTNNIRTIGEDTKHFFIWTEEDLNAYKKYISEVKMGRPIGVDYIETNNLDTLYHRRLRAKKQGNTELYNLIQDEIDAVKNGSK